MLRLLVQTVTEKYFARFLCPLLYSYMTFMRGCHVCVCSYAVILYEHVNNVQYRFESSLCILSSLLHFLKKLIKILSAWYCLLNLQLPCKLLTCSCLCRFGLRKSFHDFSSVSIRDEVTRYVQRECTEKEWMSGINVSDWSCTHRISQNKQWINENSQTKSYQIHFQFGYLWLGFVLLLDTSCITHPSSHNLPW